MLTKYGEVPEDDILALEYKLRWYFRYGNVPTGRRREAGEARQDYGVQYERFVGHLFEEKGFQVHYSGILEGKTDGGIDLVARASRKIRLIQCKRWRVPVDSDVISRLAGAVERFQWEKYGGKIGSGRIHIVGVLATSGSITPEAAQLASHLNICVMEHLVFRVYPVVKAKRILPDAGRLYLPFSPEYDRLTMNVRNGDRFFCGVREAFSENYYYGEYHRPILRRIYELQRDAKV